MIGVLCAVLLLQAGVDPILEKFRAARPADADLGIYTLSWMPTLKEARERAGREGRPVFLLVCTNSYGNMYTGHC